MVFLSFFFYGWGVRCLICEDKKEDKKGWAAFCESKKRTLASSFLDLIFDFLFLFQGLGWEGLGSMRVRGVTSWDETRPFPGFLFLHAAFSPFSYSTHFPPFPSSVFLSRRGG
jgi:hypothetical protein